MVLLKILFAFDLKHSIFWTSADVKPISNDLENTMLVFYLYVQNKLECLSFASLSGLV
jgi:hypothetical protein